LDLNIQLERLRDGSRKVVTIAEIQGMEGDVITTSDIFKFQRAGFENGRVIGKLRPTGLRPRFMTKIEREDIMVPSSIFGVRTGRRH
jgi:pilus assembly protein CpaF